MPVQRTLLDFSLRFTDCQPHLPLPLASISLPPPKPTRHALLLPSIWFAWSLFYICEYRLLAFPQLFEYACAATPLFLVFLLELISLRIPWAVFMGIKNIKEAVAQQRLDDIKRSLTVTALRELSLRNFGEMIK